jgi:4-oxalocrotonate tautomerase
LPFVQITLFERPVEMKRKLLELVTEAICNATGVPKERVHVVINDLPKENLMTGGTFGLDLK